MAGKRNDIIEDVGNYYSAKLAEHGDNARGVDWNGEESQFLRFEQLCKIIDSRKPFSLNDVGCGYGALYAHLASCYHTFSYEGCDISRTMIDAAQKRYDRKSNAAFFVARKPSRTADYGIASGIFNVRLAFQNGPWRKHLQSMLDILDRSSAKGFAFNCLTSYSDKDKMKAYLYYANPCELFDLCKKRYSRDVALLHDYGLYEFTILIRKKR